MAKKRSFTRSRRRYKKNDKKFKHDIMKVPRGAVSSFPNEFITKHRYVETISLNSQNGIIADYVFRVNSLYDPNQTGIGHSPLYYDQCAAIWYDYCVLGSKITVDFSWASDATPPPTGTSVLVGTHIDEDTTLDFTGKDEMMEENRIRYTFLGHNQNNKRVTNKYAAKKFHGVVDLRDNITLWGGGGDPTDVAFGHVFMYSNSATAYTIQATVKIDYIAIWRNLKDITQS